MILMFVFLFVCLFVQSILSIYLNSWMENFFFFQTNLFYQWKTLIIDRLIDFETSNQQYFFSNMFIMCIPDSHLININWFWSNFFSSIDFFFDNHHRSLFKAQPTKQYKKKDLFEHQFEIESNRFRIHKDFDFLFFRCLCVWLIVSLSFFLHYMMNVSNSTVPVFLAD